MGVDGIFPENGTAPSLGVQLGGVPLADVLADMMRLIRCQQQELDALRRDSEEKMYRCEYALQKHEEAIKNLSGDVKLDLRPISCYGQPPMSTMADVVTNIEYRLARAENREKRETAARLRESSGRKLANVFYTRWVRYRNMQGSRRLIQDDTRKSIWQRYMYKWNGYLAIRSKQQAQRRHIKALLVSQERRVALAYWRKWRLLVDTRERIRLSRQLSAHDTAEVLVHITARSLALRTFNYWVMFVESTRNARNRARGALLLEQETARLLAERYLRKWMDAHQWRRLLLMRLRALEIMRSRICRELARSSLDNWISFVAQRKNRRRVRSLVPHLHHINLAALARRYFSRLFAFRLLCRELRAKEAMEQRMKLLSERADGLQRQLDMGLHTLAHTNSVLARIVDTVVIAEEPRSAIQNLLQQEMMISIPTVPSVTEASSTREPSVASFDGPMRFGDAGPSMEQEWQSNVDHDHVSASEMLQKLRERLDKSYKAASGVPQKSV
ncbi:hypothetical protein DQ04_03151070 [Trypanosoma grayi]|uniref:hypothetical protein n=1 Tax=Trypanosoma grayi TaxID=71804 RepID=UPI0004F4BD7B|nr:hypothetical protein DQ04_03151070 [Trypanosoma grayi]KEG10922.1 hypothetical protein DQ04_03151070 [Trypanosoma grayi]